MIVLLAAWKVVSAPSCFGAAIAAAAAELDLSQTMEAMVASPRYGFAQKNWTQPDEVFPVCMARLMVVSARIHCGH